MAKSKAKKLKVIPLGGVDGIGRNITVFEYGDDIVIIDCGVSFPEDDMLGIDLVIPDFSYLEQNEDKIRGLLLTHGHEDHIGAVPYLLKQFNIPVYGTRLTLGILENKLTEHGLMGAACLHEVEAGDSVKLGCFTAEFVRVNHSIADSVAIALGTPKGMVVHTGDFKIDLTPIDGAPINLHRFAELGKKGVKLLLCDSTNVERGGYTHSEKVVGASFDKIFEGCEKRIVIATFSSNIHRIQQIINASVKYGRKVAVTGRSMINVMRAAERLGYMDIPEGTLIELGDMKRYKMEQLTLITTGSQGEPMSALYRMALGEHNLISLGSDDLVILSSSPIPGNEKLISRIVNELLKRGVNMIRDSAVDVHVSGHACAEELKIIHTLVSPEYFMPVHGEYKHLKTHADLAKQLGMEENRIFIPETGHALEIGSKKAQYGSTVPWGQIYVDGYGVGDVGSSVLKERKHLAEDGMFVIVFSVDLQERLLLSDIEIISRGFVYMREQESLIEDVRALAKKTVLECFGHGNRDANSIKNKVKDAVSSKLYSKTKKKPMVLPVLTDISL
ncbi:MAG: ribonuclease J [Clostridia bacterium]|nr:ribonuclease J [Clostridia bacterium]